jgi:DNA-binding CsgD family transcriptional regulator
MRPIETLVQTLASLRTHGVDSRDLVSSVLRGTLEANPAWLAVWCAWEPDAFDGRDREHRHTAGHDATGRYVPYLHRARGGIQLEPLHSYADTGAGDWYGVLRSRGELCVTDKPFLYTIAGRPHWITCEIAPLHECGVFRGVAGIDFSARPVRRANATIPTLRALGGASARLRLLTAREREVHYWMCQGKSNEEIGILLGISSHTVKNHLSPIFAKLGVENRYAAIALAAGG